MRLHRLEVTGFGPFHRHQVVDFDAFAEDGIFLISGRTGAGKSSVLDGVSFALYGGIPRYDGADKRVRSDHCAPEDPTVVVVEFTASGRRWRVTRSPEYERPKKNGTGTTTEPHRATLEEDVDGQWIGRAARPVDVAHELDGILGVNQQQFQQVILLAQGRFAQFLHARSDERQKLLRRLFGTRTYEDYQHALEERRRVSERELAEAGSRWALLIREANRVAEDAEIPCELAERAAPEQLAELERVTLRARYRADTALRDRDAADAEHRRAEAAHAAARTLREAQVTRAALRADLDRLEADSPALSDRRVALERARRAESLREGMLRADAAAEAAAVARAAAAAASAEWTAAEGAPVPSLEELPALTAELIAAAARLERGREAEALLESLAKEIDALLSRLESLDRDVADLDERRALLPERLRDLDDQLTAARTAAAGAEAALDRLLTVQAQRDAARRAETLAAASQQADLAHLAAGERAQSAQEAVTALLRRRLQGVAGELAAALVPGEPCVVCGSAEHPHPAPPQSEPVDDSAIDEAERLRDAAARVVAEASESARAAREAHAAAVAAAGGESAEVLEARVAEAQLARDAALDAEALRDRLVAERLRIESELVAADAARTEILTMRAGVTERLQSARDQADGARAVVDRARGGFASVAEHLADLEARRERAVTLEAVLQSARTADDLERVERDAWQVRVAASDFSAAAEVRAAVREPALVASWDAELREHDIALRTVREQLRELELRLAGEPEEPVDVEAAAATLAGARDAWVASVDAAARAEQAADRLAALVAQAGDAVAGEADAQRAHAALTRLADTVAGRAPNTHRMTLESFVLAAELEEIVAAANVRLADMSAGRYTLHHTDARAARGAASGLGLEVMDAFTGQCRPAQSLSGGETFLASLALALGLAEVVSSRAGGVKLDTLFVDEGFGSLDDETLEVAMRTLDELRQGGRTVGLISHVAAMKEQIPAQLQVSATAAGPSVIRADVRV